MKLRALAEEENVSLMMTVGELGWNWCVERVLKALFGGF
jgi:hypothetical protein